MKLLYKKKTSFPPLLMDTALVYSKGSSTVTQKKAPNNICFNDLDVTLSSLIELIYCEQKNNPFSFMNFVPEDDKGLGRVTNDMVKGIVTCLECEIARLKNPMILRQLYKTTKTTPIFKKNCGFSHL